MRSKGKEIMAIYDHDRRLTLIIDYVADWVINGEYEIKPYYKDFKLFIPYTRHMIYFKYCHLFTYPKSMSLLYGDIMEYTDKQNFYNNRNINRFPCSF